MTTYSEALRDPTTNWIQLIELSPYDFDAGSVQTLRYSDIGWASEPDDSPANTIWRRRLKSLVSIRRSIYRENAIGGAAKSAKGSARFSNIDGALDDWDTDYSFGGRKVTARRGFRGLSLSGWGVPFVGTCADEPAVTMTEATLALRDNRHLLDQQPLIPVYRGGEDGVKFSTGGRATATSATELDLTSDMCLMMTIKPPSLATSNLVGWGAGSATQYPWHLSIRSSGVLRFRYTHSGGTVVNVDSTGTFYEADTWYVVGFRIDGTNLYFYSRSLEDAKAEVTWEGPYTLAADPRDAQSGGTFSVGSSSAGVQGYVSELRIWDGNMVLSYAADFKRGIEQRVWPTDIKTDDSRGSSSMVGYYKFNEGSGTTVTDHSSSGNNLTLAGTYSWSYPLGGDDYVAGTRIPVSMGPCDLVEPVLVDPANLIYQWHIRAVNSVSEVLASGATVDKDTTYGSSGDATSLDNFLSAQAGVDFVANKFITYNALGLFKLGASPSGEVRVSGQGDAEGSYVSDPGDILERLLTVWGPFDSSDLDSTVLTAFKTATSGKTTTLHIAPDDTRKITEWVDLVLAGVMGWSDFNQSDGKMIFKIFSAPSGSEDHTIKEHQLRKGALNKKKISQPLRSHRVSYGKKWAPYRKGVIEGTASASRLNELTKPHRLCLIREDGRTKKYKLAEPAGRDDYFETLLYNRDDAYQLGLDRQELYGSGGQRLFEVPLGLMSADVELGDEVLLEHSRFSLSAGDYFRVVSVDPGKRNLDVWKPGEL